ncbi:retinal-specific phospholipid-transporting ATPase ABCA4-like [Haemaphysalis longicornis]
MWKIQHSAVLATTLFNNARLRNVTNVGDATFSFDVSTFGLEALPQLDSWNRYSSHNKYYQVLPEVLRSIFFPLCSSLMCCAFVLFPIAERAMQVKHLHMITGVSPLLYWLTNFVFDFSFYLGTALLVLPPVVYFQYDVLTPSDIKLIFALNCLHGYAALPVIYVFSFMFNNPGVGFSTLAVWTFIISAIGCFASVFVDHYSHGESSPHLVIAIRMLLQALRMVPSTSYSRGMIKVLQLAHENAVCWKGGTELEASCRGEANQHRLSLMQCCRYLKSGDADQHAIHPLDMHSYSALSEVLSLSFEGALMFGVLLFVEWYIPRFKMCMSMLEPSAYLQGVQVPTSTQAAPHSLPRPMKGDVEDTDVARENEIVAGLVAGRLVPDTAHPYLLVNRLFKSYGYINSNPVLQGLSFTVQKGECFGLLGVNGVGKTTTFRILTGELLPHEGDAYITGVSLVQTPRQFRRYIGYCPEKDGVLDVLTGKETVLLFGRLRGLAMTPEYTNVLLDIFNLTEIANQLVRTYSSGNRRTLSLCIAVLGVPRLLLLDEPYVGIGSSARKRIINFISAIQKATEASIVLSSHSMADVEFLCNRIAILSDGQLQCIGSLANLKEKFGKGYTIIVKTYPYRKQDDDYLRDVAEAIVRAFRRAELMQIYEGQLEFHMSRVYLLWSDMFSRMANIKKRYKLQDFFITDTSLEQIFLSVARKEASSADTAAAKANARDAGSPPVALGI